jgi:transposase
MLKLPPSVKIFLATESADMRKGHDGLAALVRSVLGHDVYNGYLYVFVSRKGDRIKILGWDYGGFILFYKRLERGRFRRPDLSPDQIAVELEYTQLSMLLDGIDYSRVRKPVRWEPPRDRSIS